MIDQVYRRPKVNKTVENSSVITSEAFQHFKQHMRAEGKLGFETSRQINLKDEEKLADVLKF